MGVARVAMTAGFVTVAAGIGLWVWLLIYPSNHVPALRPLFYAQFMLGVYAIWVLYNVENKRLGPTPRWIKYMIAACVLFTLAHSVFLRFDDRTDRLYLGLVANTLGGVGLLQTQIIRYWRYLQRVEAARS